MRVRNQETMDSRNGVKCVKSWENAVTSEVDLGAGKLYRFTNDIVGKTNRDVTALLVESPASEMLPGIDGIIGIGALKAHHINFDFSARTVRWD